MESDIFINDGDALMSLTVLSNHPVFSAFSTHNLIELISGCTVNTYRVNEIVVHEGDLVDAVFFILGGQCEVRKHVVSASGEAIEQPIATLREEESIGLSEVGLFSSTGIRTASVVTTSPAKVLCLNVKMFRDFLKNHPNAGETFSGQLDLLMRMHFIKSVAPFASIPHQHIRLIAEQIEEQFVTAGTTIFEQGDSGDACYIITAGKVEISRHFSDGRSKIVATLEENAIFGESALLMDAPRNATVRVIEPATLLKIDKLMFNGITHQHVDAQEALMHLQLKRCRPLRLNNIDVYKQINVDGEEIVLLRNTELGHYVQLSEHGLFLWNLLDGELSINEITLQFFRQFNVFHVEDIASQIINLHNEGFIVLSRNEIAIGPVETRNSILSKIREVMEYRVLFGNVDEWMAQTFHRVRWIFYSTPALILWPLLIVSGFASFVFYFGRTVDLLAVSPHKWTLFLIPVFLMTLTVPLHELAHAVTTKYYGRKVSCFGLGWYWFSPFAYCDTSDMWLSSRKQRVMVDLAGVYLNAMLAGLAGLCAYFLFPVFSDLAIVLELFALCSYLFILANLNTVVELDGYYALMNGLDKPDLRLSSIKWGCALFSSRDAKSLLTWDSIKTHYKEAIYWVVTLISVFVVGTVVPYMVLTYLLSGLFGISNPILAIVLTTIVVIVSLSGVYKEFLLRIFSKKIP